MAFLIELCLRGARSPLLSNCCVYAVHSFAVMMICRSTFEVPAVLSCCLDAYACACALTYSTFAVHSKAEIPTFVKSNDGLARVVDVETTQSAVRHCEPVRRL